MNVIRLVEPRDFPAIAALTNHFIRTTAIHFAYEDVSGDELATAWREKQDLYPWLVTEVDGVFAGYAKASAYRTRTAYQWTPETGIYVHSAMQGRGVGRSLYARLLLLLAAQGFRSAIGGIALPNAASVALHERLGFVPCGTVQAAGFKFDRWHDVGFWQKPLGNGGGAILSPLAAWAQLPG